MTNLAKAICQVMARVRYVPETGRNQFHRYSYASDEDLLTVLQPAMAEAGLAMLPSLITSTTVEHSPDHKGKAQWRTEVLVTYTLIHTSGESATIQATGCGIDGEDKGCYKALTGALKYALRHTFLVPTGEDAERARAAQDEEPPAPKPKKPPKAEPPSSPRSPAPAHREPSASSAPRGDVEGTTGGTSEGTQGGRWTDDERRGFFRELEASWPQPFEEEDAPRRPRYEHLAAWCESLGQPRPSEMGRDRRARLLGSIRESRDVRVRIDAWIRRQEGEQPEPGSDLGEVSS